MKEIGSEFWSVPTAKEETGAFPLSTQWYASGRSALQAILREIGGARTVAMPSWCCDSMVKPFVGAGLEVRFYPVAFEREPAQQIRLDCDVLFLMDYFGYSSPAPDLGSYRGVVVRDVTHSLFSRTHDDADYFFGSLRKWCGVWTGGYAWTRDGRILSTEGADDLGYAALRERAMALKATYMDGAENGSGKTADKGYLKIFEVAEDCLEDIGVAPAARRDVSAARRLDVDFIRSRRRANAHVLREALPDWLLFREMKETDCPLFVPVLVPDGRRDALRRFLIKRDIYCPVHWPVSAYHKLEEKTRLIYENELSLVCDQRYGIQDMNRIIETINLFQREA